MMDSKMRWPNRIATKLAAAAVTIAFAATGAATANAAMRSHTGEPPEFARRSVPAMIPPGVAALQMSTTVTGVLAAPEADEPLADHDLHFQGRISGNLYTVRTAPNGAFSTMLPQGVYDLRGMHGTVIVRAVMVGRSPVDLGQVSPPGPYNVWALFERQAIGEAIVKSPAPATVYLPNAGEGSQPIAVTPISSPRVMGAGPNGEPFAPAEVIPEQTYEQTEIPPGAEVPAPGMPPAQDMEPAPKGGY